MRRPRNTAANAVGTRRSRCCRLDKTALEELMKVLLWIVAIIFLIGLLVVFGIFNLVF
jgi:hypothetical protein